MWYDSTIGGCATVLQEQAEEHAAIWRWCLDNLCYRWDDTRNALCMSFGDCAFSGDCSSRFNDEKLTLLRTNETLFRCPKEYSFFSLAVVSFLLFVFLGLSWP